MVYDGANSKTVFGSGQHAYNGIRTEVLYRLQELIEDAVKFQRQAPHNLL